MTSPLASGLHRLGPGGRSVVRSAPGSAAPRMLRGALAAGVVGALTLIEPRRLGPFSRTAYRLGAAVVGGAVLADASREDMALIDPVRDAVMAGAVTFGLMELGEHVDAWLVDGLRHRGVPCPRLLLTGLAAAGTAALYALPTAQQDHRWGTIEEAFGQPETVDLPEEARALIELLLANPAAGTGVRGAPALREQLVTARSVDPGYPTADLQIEVEAPARLAVPHHQTWPVIGEFTRDGIRFELQLQISEGTLGMLSILVPDDELRLEDAIAQLSSPRFALPDPDQVTVRAESDQPA